MTYGPMGVEPNLHPNPDTLPACRPNAAAITSALPATCNALRARVSPV